MRRPVPSPRGEETADRPSPFFRPPAVGKEGAAPLKAPQAPADAIMRELLRVDPPPCPAAAVAAIMMSSNERQRGG